MPTTLGALADGATGGAASNARRDPRVCEVVAGQDEGRQSQSGGPDAAPNGGSVADVPGFAAAAEAAVEEQRPVVQIDNGPLMQYKELRLETRARTPAADEEDIRCESLSFVEGDRFQTFISVVIGANVVVLATETDHPEWIGWSIFDTLFVFAFLIELVLRVLYRGVKKFFDKDTGWAVLDVVIVSLGVFDSWIEPLLVGACITSSESAASNPLVKVVRLLRLLRMFRVVKIFPKLMAFTQALVEMFGTMIWIFTFLILLMVCFAIILTRELGLGDSPYAAEEGLQELRLHFQDVATSLFTLFQVSTQDDWMNIAGPLVDSNPAWSLFFVGFIVFVSWTMISVLTAVASESMVAATTDRKEQEVREAEARAKEFINFLEDAFKKADADGNELLDKEEFEAMMKKEFVIEQMRNMGFSMTEEEMGKAWDMLDIDRGGELTIDSFVSGLTYLQEKLTTRHVISISYRLKRVGRRLNASIDRLFRELNELVDQNEQILACLERKEKLVEQQRLSIWLWHQWMQKNDPELVKDAHPQRPSRLRVAGLGPE